MALTMKWFGKGLDHLANGAIDFDTDTIKASLHTSTYTPNQDTDDFFNDCTNELASGNGYTTGGATLASKTRTYDATSNEERLDAADVTWNFTASKTFRYLVIYKVRGGASTADEVIGYGDFGSDQTVSTDFTVTWHADGILKITAS
jgi:hypothetical protein